MHRMLLIYLILSNLTRLSAINNGRMCSLHSVSSPQQTANCKSSFYIFQETDSYFDSKKIVADTGQSQSQRNMTQPRQRALILTVVSSVSERVRGTSTKVD